LTRDERYLLTLKTTRSVIMRFFRICLTGIFIGVAPTSAFALLAGEAADGKPVHDNFCMGCHVSVAGGDGGGIYLRENRNVKSIEGLMGAVAFCNQQTKTGLNDHELDDIVAYLNETYYQFETD
jgi:hypothetical protein